MPWTGYWTNILEFVMINYGLDIAIADDLLEYSLLMLDIINFNCLFGSKILEEMLTP